jgi:hypothetical protein
MSDLIMYRIHNSNEFFVRSAPRERDWMDDTNVKFAYRCLPLAIANQHGWEISIKDRVRAVWDGTNGLDAIKILEGPTKVASSHFGYGVLTFSLNFLFRSEKNINLYVTGTPNHPKRGISPLTGIVETDWNPATFTMNWQFTEPNHEVVFEPFEPICFFFPVTRKSVEETQLILRPLEKNEFEKKNYDEWAASRAKVNKEGTGEENGWEKHYFQGIYNSGAKCPVDHQTKLKVGDLIKED